jgi:hypothetical protein
MRLHPTHAFLALLLLAPTSRAEERTTALDFPARLSAGSLVGAGIDETAPGEIIRPTTSASLLASLRKLGGIITEGKSSAAVQVNPYLLSLGGEVMYTQISQKRDKLGYRLLQDSTISLAVTPGTPAIVGTPSASRFTTVGLGASVELLGQRSIYSKHYRECLTKPGQQEQAIMAQPVVPPKPLIYPKPPDPNPGETVPDTTRLQQYEYELKKYEYKRQNPEQDQKQYAEWLEKLSKAAAARVEECTTRSNEQTQALFFSVGGRWVAPGVERQPEDAYFVQREYVALTYDFMTASKISVGLQVRALGDRPDPRPFEYLFDGGVSLNYIGEAVRWNLDIIQPFSAPTGSLETGVFAGSVQVKLDKELFLSFGVRGMGRDVGEAFGKSTVTLSLVYEKKPILTHKYVTQG